MGKRNVMVSLLPSEYVPKDVCHYFRFSPDSVCRMNGMLYLQTPRGILACEDNADGNELISALQKCSHTDDLYVPEHENDVWYQIITESDRESVAELAKKHRIDACLKRIVVLFRKKYPVDHDLLTIFGEIVPMEVGDHPVRLDRDTMALIKTTENCGENEIAEYTAAVIDSMISEGVSDLQAGIGMEAGSVFELHRGFEEARTALMTGTAYHADKNLFRYSEQKLERIVDRIPSESRTDILADFYSRCPAETFSDEMMETIRVFFSHDLNITSASRQLFIHRNTLNYRLDKFRKETGLDLRTFQDAAVFRLILEISEKNSKK